MTRRIEYQLGDRLEKDSKLTFLLDDTECSSRIRKGFFLCECGNVKSIFINLVKKGNTKSCGCLHKEKVSTHGMGYIRVYKIWKGINYRGKDPNYKHYEDIGICERWSNDEGLMNFIEDMGLPEKGQSIDRYDSNLGYTPENCRWTDNSNQLFNRTLLATNKSGRTGVSYDKKFIKPWYAILYKDKKRVLNERYATFEEAVKAREDAELKYYGRILDYYENNTKDLIK